LPHSSRQSLSLGGGSGGSITQSIVPAAVTALPQRTIAGNVIKRIEVFLRDTENTLCLLPALKFFH
jgi:hypothetical protein